jgi:hypothetical protein
VGSYQSIVRHRDAHESKADRVFELQNVFQGGKAGERRSGDTRSRQIDKLSQRVGEKVFNNSKTQLSDEFKDFEAEIEIRRAGVERFVLFSGA